MTQEDKDLLLKDICARLPYGVQVQVSIPYVNIDFDKDYDYITNSQNNCVLTLSNISEIQKMADEIKPYLRPMSTMTEEEEEEYNNLVDLLGENEPYFVLEQMMVDFYHKHHFDNRFLIPKGLAIEAPEDMYNFN